MTAERASLKGHLQALRFLQNSYFRNGWVRNSASAPDRMKIEVEYSSGIEPLDHLYIETHFSVNSREALPSGVAFSRNLLSGKVIATDRCYDPKLFHDFAQSHQKLGRKVELCLFDSNVQHDSKYGWVKVPKKIGQVSEKLGQELCQEVNKLFRQFARPKGGLDWPVN